MHRLLCVVAVLALAVSACSHAQPSSSATPLASTPIASETPVPASSASPNGASASPQPSATITATPDPNLLSQASGTILRAYPTGVSDPSSIDDYGLDATADPSPRTIVYELPGTASIAYFQATLPVPATSASPASLDLAISTTSATAGYQDVGSLHPNDSGTPQRLVAGLKARWVRVTSEAPANSNTFQHLSAQGAFDPRPTSAPLAGVYEEYKTPYSGGQFAPHAVPSPDDWFMRVVNSPDGSINGMLCSADDNSTTYPGSFDGRYWRWFDWRDTTNGIWVINDEGDMIVGDGMIFGREKSTPEFCGPREEGKGSKRVLVLDNGGGQPFYPADNAAEFPDYRFVRLGDSEFEPQMLANASIAVIARVCSDADFDAAQGHALIQWVGAGHKLIIEDADTCTTTSYTTIPYAFKTSNPGAHGTPGKNLIVVENDTLGSADPTDARYFIDTKAYIANPNDLGDANTTTSTDPHWCGHIFGTNLLNVNGFMQMYALYENGLIIYSGLDKDDGVNAQYVHLEHLQLDQPVGVAMPCTQKISLSFIVEPESSVNFTPGQASTSHFKMEVLANQGWAGSLAIKAVGDLAATVSPTSATMKGGTQPLAIVVTIPKSARAVPHVVDVIATATSGTTSDATITLNPREIIAKKFKRIRIYGIHFNVDSAVIQPQSESVISQIAAILRDNPTLRLRIEGHTDSDGGAAHNLVLSQHRAQSVVDDLVHRYGIARSRLEPVGYGLTRPVAPNTTKANKALNRRVELVAL